MTLLQIQCLLQYLGYYKNRNVYINGERKATVQLYHHADRPAAGDIPAEDLGLSVRRGLSIRQRTDLCGCGSLETRHVIDRRETKEGKQWET